MNGLHRLLTTSPFGKVEQCLASLLILHCSQLYRTVESM